MKMGHPEYLILLVFVVISLGLVVRLFRINKGIMTSAGTPTLITALVQGVSTSKQRLKFSMVLTGLLLLTVALAGPQWGIRPDILSMKGRDIIVAVDVSGSMLARDVEPDRLSRAKIEIASLLTSLALEGDRVGLLAFEGDSLPVVPLTTDYDSVKEFLGGLSVDIIPYPGTNIGRAIEASLRLLPQDGPARSIILLTDGEDTYGGARTAADSAKAQGVGVFPVGIGSDKGEPIPSDKGGFKRDRTGKVVLSRLDEKLLEEIARTTGGTFIKSRPGTIGVDKVYGEIKKMEKREWENRIQTHLRERFQYPLSLAYLLLFGEFILTERRRKK